MNIKTIFKTIILAVFFLSTLYLVIDIPIIFNSPDESANFLFSREVAATGMPRISEQRNEDLHGLLGPRSMSSVKDSLVPTSFLGMPVVFGALGSVFGIFFMLIITPILSILTVLAWRSIILQMFKKIFIADVSAFLFMIHPAFWYYSGRTMMHNVAFLSFLIFGVWFAFRQSKQHVDFILAGLCIGLALAFRTSEVMWVLPSCAAILFIVRRHTSWEQRIVFFASVLLALIPFMLFNNALYGSVLTTGYQADLSAVPFSDSQSIEVIQYDDEESLLARVTGLILPFGFHEKAILRHVWQYGVALYPWMSILSLIGMVLLFYRCENIVHRDRWKWMLGVTFLLSVWLGIFYGSWTFHDNPDPTIFSLGNSYVRYWLPLFLLSTPFAALALFQLSRWLRVSRARYAVIGLLLCIMTALSTQLVFFGDDGFIPTRRALYSFAEKRSVILENTMEDSIVIVDRADKFVFPHRSVIQPLRSEATYQSIPTMLNLAPLYYFGITFPEHDLKYLNDKKLQELDASIHPVVTVGDETLYRIVSLQ
jgi:hypothetical protein